MARRWLLGEAAQARLLGLPADEREVIRYATLGPEDLALVAERRGEANQLGFALMLVCLRHPVRVPEPSTPCELKVSACPTTWFVMSPRPCTVSSGRSVGCPPRSPHSSPNVLV